MNSKDVVNMIYNYRLSVECVGSWFMVYRGERPVERVRTGFFTWEHILDIDKALAYELSVTDAVCKAVKKIQDRES